MSAAAQDEASARSQRFLTAYGKQAAQRVWDRIQRHGYGPEEVSELVSDEVEVLTILIDEKGIREPDRSTILHFFEAAVVAEGKQLAILFAADTEGTA